MHTQRTTIIITSILGAVFTFSDWAQLPIVGKTQGISSGFGVFALLCFVVIVVLGLIGDKVDPIQANKKTACALLCVGALLGCFLFLRNISTANEIYRRGNDISNNLFGALSMTDILSPIAIEPGVYVTGVTGLVLLVIILASGGRKSNEADIEEDESSISLPDSYDSEK